MTSGAVTQVDFTRIKLAHTPLSIKISYVLDRGILSSGGSGNTGGALHHCIALGTALRLEFSNLGSAVASELSAVVSGDLGIRQQANKVAKAVKIPREQPAQRQGACQSRHDRQDGLVGASALSRYLK